LPSIAAQRLEGATLRSAGALVHRSRRACLATALVAGGCSLAGGHPAPLPTPSAEAAPGWTAAGIASWYGQPHHGNPTASGEIFDQEAATGAHRTLPFGTRIRVENLDNGRSAILTINDRGPFVKDRILDVSRRVARELGMLGLGTARVRITVLELPKGGGSPTA